MIILNRLVVGGTAANTLHLVHALKKEYKVVLVTGRKEEDEMDVPYDSEAGGEVAFIRLPSLTRGFHIFNDISTYFRLKKLIAQYRPVLVQTIGTKPGFIGRLAAWRQKVPVIIHAYHGFVFHSYVNPLASKVIVWLERLAASKTTMITTVSARQKQELAVVYRIAPAHKIVHIPIGVEIEKFTVDSALLRKAFRDKYYLAEDDIAIGIVGRIAPVKNHALFLALATQFYKTENRQLRFFIVGDGPSLREKMEKQLTQNNIDYTFFPSAPRKAFITFTSWITDIESAINGLDIVVLTSHNEGTPVSLIEAQLAGKPVVATNAGGVREVVQHGATGFVCATGDITCMCNSLQQLIDDAAVRQRLGSNGKNFMQHNFNLASQLRYTISLYKSLLSSLPHSRY